MKYRIYFKGFFIVFFFVLILSFLKADITNQEIIIKKYEHLVDLEEKNTFHEIKINFIKQSEAEYFLLEVPRRIRNLNIAFEEFYVNCSLSEKEKYSLISCPIEKYPLKKELNLYVSFSTTTPIIKTGNNIIFNYFFNSLYFCENIEYKIKLPQGFILPPDRESSFFVNPSQERVFFDGRQTIISITEKNIENALEISVFMEPQIILASGFYLILFFVFMIILILIGLFFYFKKNKKNTEYHALIESENTVVDTLKNSKEKSLWQKQIQTKTNLTKVKLSRILQSIEKRKVIKKEPWGRTNKIYLLEKD